MTSEEKQEIINAVLAALRTNSKTIGQLTPVSEMSNTDFLELNGGRKVSYGVLFSNHMSNDEAQESWEYLDTKKVDKDSRGLVEVHQAPVIYLDAMGVLDGHALNGDNGLEYRTDTKLIYDFPGGLFGAPKAGAVYISKNNFKKFVWNGTDLEELKVDECPLFVDYSEPVAFATLPVGGSYYVPSSHKIAVKIDASSTKTYDPLSDALYFFRDKGKVYTWNSSTNKWVPVSSDINVVNNLTDGGEADALSAEMGKELNDRLLEVCGGISYEDKEVITEETTNVTLIDGHYIATGQGVGNVCPMTVSDYAGISYATFELKAGDKFFAKGVAGSGAGGRLWAILDKTTHEILAVHDGVYNTSGNTITVPDEETVTVEQDCIVVVNAYNAGANPAYGNSALTPYSFKKTVYTTEIVPEGTPVDGILGGMQEDIEELQEAVGQETSYKGLKLAALGDSITWGYTPRNYSGHTAGDQLNSFAKVAAQRLGMTFANFGISGSTVSVISGQNRNPMCQRYSELPNDADIILFMGGVNDVSYNGALGTMDDRVNSTFYGALHIIFQGLYTKYIGGVTPSTGKKKKIIVCTPIKSLDASKLTKTNSIANNADVLLEWDEWIEAIKEVATFYSFPVLDMYNLSGINPHLDRAVDGTTSWGASGHFNPYITDGVHPTQEGAEMMADVLVGFLKGLK